MKNRQTGSFLLLAAIVIMALVTRKGSAQEFDPKAYYEIVSSKDMVLDNQGNIDNNSQIFINNRAEGRTSQVWTITPSGDNCYIKIR